MKLRIKFSKYSAMIFIGHLDIMRYFQKAMRRAEVDISYSTGFSPHQIMSFAQPLGVGMYSNGEYLDISVDSLTSTEDVKNALQGVMVEGVDILSVKALPDNIANAMASVAAAGYTVRFRDDSYPGDEVGEAIEKFLAQDTIPVIKETKKGTKEFDLKEHIYTLSYDKDAQTFSMLVDASSSGNVKPGFVMDTLYKYCGMEAGEFDYIICREETYAFDPENDNKLVPLEALGNDYPSVN